MKKSRMAAERQRDREREYERAMLRSAFASLFWSAVEAKRRRGGYTLQDLADALGKDKSVISRWFGHSQNWTVDTIADIAAALDLELRVEAIESATGAVFALEGEKKAEPPAPRMRAASASVN
jgi:transcriptional regulator with XRE-family HTH domain